MVVKRIWAIALGVALVVASPSVAFAQADIDAAALEEDLAATGVETPIAALIGATLLIAGVMLTRFDVARPDGGGRRRPRRRRR